MVVDSAPFRPIETPRLRLRYVEEHDASSIATMMTETVSRRLASWPVPCTPLMAEDRIQRIRIAAAERRSMPLVIERRGDGTVCGWISISRSPWDPRTALLTYWLGEAFHRRGFMREAAPVAIRRAFQVLDVDSIRAAVQPDNVPSLAVMRLVGMAPLGPGHIWCPARQRDEECLWFELLRPQNALMPESLASQESAPA